MHQAHSMAQIKLGSCIGALFICNGHFDSPIKKGKVYRHLALSLSVSHLARSPATINGRGRWCARVENVWPSGGIISSRRIFLFAIMQCSQHFRLQQIASTRKRKPLNCEIRNWRAHKYFTRWASTKNQVSRNRFDFFFSLRSQRKLTPLPRRTDKNAIDQRQLIIHREQCGRDTFVCIRTIPWENCASGCRIKACNAFVELHIHTRTRSGPLNRARLLVYVRHMKMFV